MHADPVLLKRIGRGVALALAEVAILAAGFSLHRREPAVSPTISAPLAVDPLSAELARCRAMIRPDDVDDACRAAWAEVRRRFFAPHDANGKQP